MEGVYLSPAGKPLGRDWEGRGRGTPLPGGLSAGSSGRGHPFTGRPPQSNHKANRALEIAPGGNLGQGASGRLQMRSRTKTPVRARSTPSTVSPTVEAVGTSRMGSAAKASWVVLRMAP